MEGMAVWTSCILLSCRNRCFLPSLMLEVRLLAGARMQRRASVLGHRAFAVGCLQQQDGKLILRPREDQQQGKHPPQVGPGCGQVLWGQRSYLAKSYVKEAWRRPWSAFRHHQSRRYHGLLLL